MFPEGDNPSQMHHKEYCIHHLQQLTFKINKDEQLFCHYHKSQFPLFYMYLKHKFCGTNLQSEEIMYILLDEILMLYNK